MLPDSVQLFLELLFPVLLGGGQLIFNDARLFVALLCLDLVDGGAHFVQLVRVLHEARGVSIDDV